MEFKDKKIVMADTLYIGDYDDIAREFLDAMFGIDLDECLISDESALSDFSICCLPEGYETPKGLSRQEGFSNLYAAGRAETVRIVKEKYGLDVDATDYLITVFEQIKQSRNATSH